MFSLYLYIVPELNAWDLPAAYLSVDPAFAHSKLLADLREQEEA